jgi:beta-lactamase superfamily II metal-dependent hydrolase
MLKISVLDVGHGDFTYAETPTQQSLVIDCGSGDVVPSKFLSKVNTIHELQISHPHEDHFTDIIELAKKNIRSFRCPYIEKYSDDKIAWRTRDKTKVATVRRLKSQIPPNDAAVPVGNGFGHTVHVPSIGDLDQDDPNTASAITTLSLGNFKMVFGGDLTEEGWEKLLKKTEVVSAVRGATVYKVSHHGRDVGCSDALFNIIRPMLCVVSDKTLDSTNLETECIDWYRERTTGATVTKSDGATEKRQVLTTRCDGSVHLQIDSSGQWWCYSNTAWRK